MRDLRSLPGFHWPGRPARERTQKFDRGCAVHETIRVKSAAWDDSGVLVYTTLNHIKYCLPNGDSGIIRTLEVPVYITKVFGNIIFCLDREGKNRQIQVPLLLLWSSLRTSLSLRHWKFYPSFSPLRCQACESKAYAYRARGKRRCVAISRRSRLLCPPPPHLRGDCGNVELLRLSGSPLISFFCDRLRNSLTESLAQLLCKRELL